MSVCSMFKLPDNPKILNYISEATMKKTYLCIDLKSFYASVECVERNLDPLKTNLVVADVSRTEKTICLAVTPSLKALGISGRARLFEVETGVKDINAKRRKKAPGGKFLSSSFDADELKSNPSLELSYIAAVPQMALYMEYSTRIYDIYLKYIAPEDILVYSIDEVFMDITAYLSSYNVTPHELAIRIIRDVLKSTGITATAGIGTNMYLAKIAMDIKAKKMPADKDGVRIAELDEMSYRKELWEHKPLTDFWRIGHGYAKKLEQNHMYTMGDVAWVSTSAYGRSLLKKLFGINAKLLIDHAWGYEPCTLQEAMSYVPENKSISMGQVLHCAYDFKGARIIVREMTELLVLDLVEKHLVTDQIVLTVGYDVENLKNPKIREEYSGEIKADYLGRLIPKHAHGTANIDRFTSSTRLISDGVMSLYDKIVDSKLLIRRINLTASRLAREEDAVDKNRFEQTDMFTDYATEDIRRENECKLLEKERKIQKATVEIRNRFGKNAILKGMNLQEGATTIDRNRQIGGHRA